MGAWPEGIRPSSKAGENFHANIHAWHAMLDLICARAGDIVSEDTINSWRHFLVEFDDPESCVLIAARLQDWADEQHTEHVAPDSDPAAMAVELAFSQFGTAAPGSARSTVGRDSVLTFCDFLKHCGGFIVH